MAAELSGLQMSVLACVAAHDRMSLVTGKGQGCRASNERMSKLVRCSYARICTTLTELTELGFLDRTKPGRNTVYRVIYTDDDRLLFGNVSPASIGCRIGTLVDRIGCVAPKSNGGNQPETTSQYIPLNGVIDSVETGEDNSSEEARIAARPLGKTEFEENVGGQLARFERAYQAGPINDDSLIQWFDYLQQVCDASDSADDPNYGRAYRLLESVEWPDSVWTRAA